MKFKIFFIIFVFLFLGQIWAQEGIGTISICKEFDLENSKLKGVGTVFTQTDLLWVFKIYNPPIKLPPYILYTYENNKAIASLQSEGSSEFYGDYSEFKFENGENILQKGYKYQIIIKDENGNLLAQSKIFEIK